MSAAIAARSVSALSAPPPIAAVDVGALFALLERVHDVPDAAPGEIALSRDGAPQGSIFVESHAVCWAAARGLGRRLVDLLAAADDRLDSRRVEGIFRACRDAGKPLGEALVAEGFVTPEALRSALLRHTVESCALLSDPALHLSWTPRRFGYAAQFTFGPAELLAAAASSHQPGTAERAARVLDAVLPHQRAFAFQRTESARARLPLVARGATGLSARAVRELGGWVHGVLDVAATLGDGVRFHAASSARGGVVAWEHDGVALVVFPPDAAAFARAVVAVGRANGG